MVVYCSIYYGYDVRFSLYGYGWMSEGNYLYLKRDKKLRCAEKSFSSQFQKLHSIFFYAFCISPAHLNNYQVVNMSFRRKLKDELIRDKIEMITAMKEFEGKRYVPVEMVVKLLNDIAAML